MRARYPDAEGYVERDGVKVFYEVFGDGEPAILMMPTTSIIHSRMWKAQIPYLAQRFRVITFDPRGNGRSDRPVEVHHYADDHYLADTLQVMDAAGVSQAVLVGLCTGCRWSVLLAMEHPERVLGIVAFAPNISSLSLPDDFSNKFPFEKVLDTDEGWAKENRHYWLRDWRGYVEFFFGEMLPEPHSTKQWEDVVGWALETDAEIMLRRVDAPMRIPTPEDIEEAWRKHPRPVLVVHGMRDQCQPHSQGKRLAELTGGSLVTFEDGGHVLPARQPVKSNLLIRDFAQRFMTEPAASRWTRSLNRPRRALLVSSPIGLGHSRRDLAVAQELRKLHPDLIIDWLAQHPLTELLEAAGENIHPASTHLANESSHIESECAEHDLHIFQTIRSMDEILVNNFMVFSDLVDEEPYDLWIADEGWELDYFLHENPELKRSPFVWLTDFVGWLPMPDGGDREADITADYNAEMIEHVARYPRLRDRSIFVGNPDDIVPDDFGVNMPTIRSWTEQNFAFSGYITGFDVAALADRAALRDELGYRDDERVCVVTVGGSGVGVHLLQRVIAAHAHASKLIDGLRMIVVAGPRIDPASVPETDGLEARGFVPDLYRHLAACDLAIVHGGLSTTMELTALGRPFLYFPIRHHFEQNFHVGHRLQRYGAGRCMDILAASPEDIAEAMAQEIGRTVSYRPVEADGAARAASMIAELL